MTDPGAAVLRSIRAIRDLEPPAEAGKAIIAQIVRYAPRKTGRLARSAKVVEPGLVAVGVPYARVIDVGWHRHNITASNYAEQAAAAAVDDVAEAYAKAAQKQLNKI